MEAVRAGIGKDRRMKKAIKAYNNFNQLNSIIMKKTMFLAAGAVLVAAAVSASVYVNSGRSSMDDLFNTNVEALARNESGNYKICYYESVVRVGYTYYDCGTCEKIYDEKGRGRISKCF